MPQVHYFLGNPIIGQTTSLPWGTLNSLYPGHSQPYVKGSLLNFIGTAPSSWPSLASLFQANNQFYLDMGSPSLGNKVTISVTTFADFFNNGVPYNLLWEGCVRYDGVQEYAGDPSIFAALSAPYTYTSPVVLSSPGSEFCHNKVDIGIGADDPILTSLPPNPPKPPTGLPGQVYSPCDPTPTILNDPEFCKNCQPGGYYAANGGWGGTMNHPSCQCCPSSPSSPDRPGYGDSLPKKMPPPKLPPKPPPPSGCEFVSVGGSSYSTIPGNGAYITYDPVNNSSTNILLKSTLALEAMLTTAIVNQAPWFINGQVYGFNGTNSKYGNIVTAFLKMWMGGPPRMYVKLQVNTVINDIFFHSYYIPDPQQPPSSILGDEPWGACAKSAYVDIVDSGTNIYEITCDPTTSTFTDTLLFNLGSNIVVAGDMVYRSSDNTIFVMVVNTNPPQGNSNNVGIKHYHYNGTLIDEIWHWSIAGWTMYCYNGEIYFLTTYEKIYRLDENPLAYVLVANPPTFNAYNPATGADGATDSACCNPVVWTDPCTDPTSSWNQMPYGYRTSWYHDPNNSNMAFSGLPNTVTVPGPWHLNQPPYPPIGPPSSWAPGVQFTLAQLNDLINEPNSIVGPWTDPTTNIIYPSRIRMENPTANIDYANQSSICEWCVDWNNAGSVPNTFDNRVLNWPGWTLVQAEALCDCCPAIDPGIAMWAFPPQGGWTGYQ
tara:strand:- start:236 stop:2371 length:2136 start_codon:yes stop_codon:yes gene_type:complete